MNDAPARTHHEFRLLCPLAGHEKAPAYTIDVLRVTCASCASWTFDQANRRPRP